MLCGKIETRKWSTNYRGLVLICAGKSLYDHKQVAEMSGADALQRMNKVIRENNASRSPGRAIAVGELIDCIPMENTPVNEAAAWVKYQEGLFLHIYSNVRPIEPFDFKGAQGWKNLTSDDVAKINFLDPSYSLDIDNGKIIRK